MHGSHVTGTWGIENDAMHSLLSWFICRQLGLRFVSLSCWTELVRSKMALLCLNPSKEVCLCMCEGVAHGSCL